MTKDLKGVALVAVCIWLLFFGGLKTLSNLTLPVSSGQDTLKTIGAGVSSLTNPPRAVVVRSAGPIAPAARPAQASLPTAIIQPTPTPTIGVIAGVFSEERTLGDQLMSTPDPCDQGEGDFWTCSERATFTAEAIATAQQYSVDFVDPSKLPTAPPEFVAAVQDYCASSMPTASTPPNKAKNEFWRNTLCGTTPTETVK